VIFCKIIGLVFCQREYFFIDGFIAKLYILTENLTKY
jgi:hypothetical protein